MTLPGAGRPRSAPGVKFATKPQLAKRMIKRAVTVRVPFAWLGSHEQDDLLLPHRRFTGDAPGQPAR
jgi:hypothetical protein